MATSCTRTTHSTGAANAATADVVSVNLCNGSIGWADAVCQLTAVSGLDGQYTEATQRLAINELSSQTAPEKRSP